MNKIINNAKSVYKKLSLPLKVSMWFFVCSLFQKGLSFLTTPLFTRLLSTNDYGIVSVYNSWEQIIVIFITMNLANSVFNVGLVRYENDKDHFQSSMLGLEIVWFVCTSIVFLLIYPIIERYVQLSNEYILIMIGYSFFTTITSMWTLRKRLDYNYKEMTIITIANTVFNVLFSVACVFLFNDKALGKITGGTIITISLGIYCIIDFLKKDKKIIDISYWKFALKYNIPMVPHFLSSVLLNQLDRIMIQNMCGLSEAGIYSVAYNSAGVVYIVNQALAASYNPWLLQRLKTKNYDKIKGIVNFILLLYFGILTAMILFAPEIMKFMAPIEYYEGIYIIPPVACSMFFILLFNLFAPVEHYSLKTKFMGVASTISAIANITLNYIFIGIYGYLAAGYTTLACYIIYAFSHWIYMKKSCKTMGISEIFDDKCILSMSVAVLAVSIISAALYKLTIIRYIFILIIIIIALLKKKDIKSILVEIKRR